MSSTYGEHLKLSIFGQSHGAGIGMVLDGIPAGLGVDLAALRAFLARRAPGQNAYSTPRKEADAPEFLSGLEEGTTCGAPIAAVIRNTNRQHRHPISGLYPHQRPGPARPRRLYGANQIPWAPGRCRRRPLLRAVDGPPLHCRRTVQAVAGTQGNCHLCPHCHDCRHLGYAL